MSRVDNNNNINIYMSGTICTFGFYFRKGFNFAVRKVYYLFVILLKYRFSEKV